MAKRPLLIVGSLDANALEVLETAALCGFTPINVIAAEQKPLQGVEWFSLDSLPAKLSTLPAVLGGTRVYQDLRGLKINVSWRKRTERLIKEAEEAGIREWMPLVHPSAFVSPSATVGVGVFIGPLVSIASESSIGDFSRVGRSTTIGHHVIVGQNCQIGPGVVVPGSVTIQEGVTVGPGAIFLNYVTIGEGALIGAGSVVTRSVKPGRQAMGNPARTRLKPMSAIRKFWKNGAKWILRRLGLFEIAKKRFGRTGR